MYFDIRRIDIVFHVVQRIQTNGIPTQLILEKKIEDGGPPTKMQRKNDFLNGKRLTHKNIRMPPKRGGQIIKRDFSKSSVNGGVQMIQKDAFILIPIGQEKETMVARIQN